MPPECTILITSEKKELSWKEEMKLLISLVQHQEMSMRATGLEDDYLWIC